MNHNRHFSEWLKDSDADYNIAKELYYKLKEKEKYTRSIWGRKSREGAMGGRLPYIY